MKKVAYTWSNDPFSDPYEEMLNRNKKKKGKEKKEKKKQKKQVTHKKGRAEFL